MLYVEYDIDVDEMEESVDRCRAEYLVMGHGFFAFIQLS